MIAKLLCCQVGHEAIHVLLCMDKQPCTTAIDCTKHMTASILLSARQQQVVSVYICHALHAYLSAVDLAP